MVGCAVGDHGTTKESTRTETMSNEDMKIQPHLCPSNPGICACFLFQRHHSGQIHPYSISCSSFSSCLLTVTPFSCRINHLVSSGTTDPKRTSPIPKHLHPREPQNRHVTKEECSSNILTVLSAPISLPSLQGSQCLADHKLEKASRLN